MFSLLLAFEVAYTYNLWSKFCVFFPHPGQLLLPTTAISLSACKPQPHSTAGTHIHVCAMLACNNHAVCQSLTLHTSEVNFLTSLKVYFVNIKCLCPLSNVSIATHNYALRYCVYYLNVVVCTVFTFCIAVCCSTSIYLPPTSET